MEFQLLQTIQSVGYNELTSIAEILFSRNDKSYIVSSAVFDR